VNGAPRAKEGGIALGLAKFGADVVIAEIDLARGEEAAARVRELDREACSCPPT
jgi:hypothetical protein